MQFGTKACIHWGLQFRRNLTDNRLCAIWGGGIHMLDFDILKTSNLPNYFPCETNFPTGQKVPDTRYHQLQRFWNHTSALVTDVVLSLLFGNVHAFASLSFMMRCTGILLKCTTNVHFDSSSEHEFFSRCHLQKCPRVHPMLYTHQSSPSSTQT